MPLPQTILSEIRAYARQHDLLRPGPLVVAVSGGADSCALLAVLAELSRERGLVLHVAHFDHRTRPRTAAADAQFVADLAGRYGASIRVGRADTRPQSEDDARGARYTFLRRVADEIGATAIATGHTRDDQAETVLLHAVRGSGLAGIAAMRPSRDGIVRPLLAIGRDDTLGICAAAGVTPREDPTNRSLRFARNRVRRRVMPELARINPQAPAALARLADAAAEALDAIRARAAASLDHARTGDGDIDLDRLTSDAGLAEEALAIAWERATGRVLTARARAALAGLATRRDGSAALDLPGGRAERTYARLALRASGSERVAAPVAAEVALTPGAAVSWDGWTLVLGSDPADGEWDVSARVPQELATGLVVRARRPGDRIAGHTSTKVQDVLTDAKVPSSERDRIPLVVTRAGEVWWIPGVTTQDAPDGWHIAARRTN